MAEKIKGYMTVKVEEASGKNKRDEYKWDGYDFEGFVKGVPSDLQCAMLRQMAHMWGRCGQEHGAVHPTNTEMLCPLFWRLQWRSAAAPVM
jgi:hypothetical protein